MIPAPELLGALHHHDVLRSLDDTDLGRIAAQIPADRALLGIGDVETARAQLDLISHLGDRLGEPRRILLLDVKQMEGKALRRLLADPGKACQLVDQALNRGFEQWR